MYHRMNTILLTFRIFQNSNDNSNFSSTEEIEPKPKKKRNHVQLGRKIYYEKKKHYLKSLLLYMRNINVISIQYHVLFKITDTYNSILLDYNFELYNIVKIKVKKADH